MRGVSSGAGMSNRDDRKKMLAELGLLIWLLACLLAVGLSFGGGLWSVIAVLLVGIGSAIRYMLAGRQPD